MLAGTVPALGAWEPQGGPCVASVAHSGAGEGYMASGASEAPDGVPLPPSVALVLGA